MTMVVRRFAKVERPFHFVLPRLMRVWYFKGCTEKISEYRGPFGIRSGSVQGPFRVRSGSVWGPFAIRWGSVRVPFRFGKRILTIAN